MKKKNKKKVLIFGYGSVGRRYAEYFSNLSYEVLIFDPFKKTEDLAYKLFQGYEELKKYKEKISYCIVCSLAKDHYKNFFYASNLGIKDILVEKPLTNNFNKSLQIKKILKKKKINLHTNHSWEYFDLDKFLYKLEKKYSMGKPSSFISYGGAFCLSTGAIHLYNILIKIFRIKLKDLNIFSELDVAKINPRSEEYRTYGGLVVMSDHKKKIIFNYSNNSKIRTNQIFIYKFFKLIFSIDGSYSLYRTDLNKDNQKITLLNEPKIIEKGFIFKRNNIAIASDYLIKKKIKVGFKSAYNSLLIFFSVLLAHDLKKKISVSLALKHLMKKNFQYPFT